MSDPLDFSDLEGTLDEGASGAPRREKPGTFLWTNPCPKCQGKGRYMGGSNYRDLGPCFMCKGSGTLTFKTSPEQRRKAQLSSQARKARVAADAVESFKIDHPAQWAWMLANPSFEFAVNMQEAVRKYGHLTTGQSEAVDRCIARAAERNAARVENKAKAGGIDVSRLAEAFAKVSEGGAKTPRLRLESLYFYGAKENSRNPGAVYCKRTIDNVYLGKIQGGVFKPSYDARPSDLEAIQAAGIDPLATALAYGLKTKRCACCGLELSDPESVA